MLRDYQVDALNAIDAALKTEKFVLLSAIMGAGKTVMVCRLINKYPSKKFLVLAHKQELVEQFHRTLLEMTDVTDIGIVCAGLGQRKFGRVTIGTIQTFFNVADYNGCDLLVIDECHKAGEDGQYAQLIERLAPSRVLGVTATPYRLGHGYIYGKHCLGTNFWPKLNHHIGYDVLMKAGYLVPLKGKVAKAVSYDIDIEQINKNGDYVLQELGTMMSKQVYLQSAVDAINEHCSGYKHICVFCTTIQHAQMLHTMLPDSTIVHSELTAAERSENMRLWMTGKRRIITSINILSEGFDWPPLECLVMARPTQSTALYLQSVGRVLRIHNGKDHGFLLDLTDNTRRFGTDLDNVFVHVPKTVEKAVQKEKNNEKICPACGKEIHKKLKVCPHCQYLYEELIADKQIGEFEDVEFTSTNRYNVIEMYDDIWQSKKSGKWLYRIRLECENGYSASVWLCFPDDGYAGFAVTQGKKWWDKFTVGAPAPSSAMSALEQRDLLWKPDFAILDVSDRYPNVKDVGFDSTPFRVEAA